MLPGQNDATYEAYDGVELRLLNGRVVRCASLTVAEAVKYLRLVSAAEVDPAAHGRFVQEFPLRIAVVGERLADLGLEVDGLAFGDLTCGDALDFVGLLLTAALTEDVRTRSRAQADFLDRFPQTVGLTDASPAQVFAAGHVFTEAIYRMIYGLAEDFCTHLSSAPGVQVLTLMGRTDALPSSRTPSSLPQDSTT